MLESELMPVSDMTPDEMEVAKAYFGRKIRTVPFLVLMLLSLMFFGTNFFIWAETQLTWHKTDAVIIEVTNGTSKYEYHVDSESNTQTGLVERIKVFYSLPYGDDPVLNKTVRIAYNVDKPQISRVFPKYESRMITWGAAFTACFVLYFWLEYDIKKRSAVRISG